MTQINLGDKKSRDLLTKERPLLLRLAVVVRKAKVFSPHVSSVWYLWENGSFWISTTEDRLKVRAIRENNRVALIIDKDVPPYKGIIVEGEATLTKVRVREVTLKIVKRYVSPKDVKTELRELMRYRRILIRIRPIKAIDIMSYRLVQNFGKQIRQ